MDNSLSELFIIHVCSRVCLFLALYALFRRPSNLVLEITVCLLLIFTVPFIFNGESVRFALFKTFRSLKP